MKTSFSELEFLFERTSKQQVEDIFEWKCKGIYKLDPSELNVSCKYLVLSIILDRWKDNDNDFPLHNVFKALYKITDSKGGRPATSLSCVLMGYDTVNQKHFVFIGEYINRHHTVVGYYDNGQQMIYQDELIFTDVINLDAYKNIINKWK